MTSNTKLDKLYRDYTRGRFAQRNDVWNSGWRFKSDNWDGKITAWNVKSGERRQGTRKPLKGGGWSVSVDWDD